MSKESIDLPRKCANFSTFKNYQRTYLVLCSLLISNQKLESSVTIMEKTIITTYQLLTNTIHKCSLPHRRVHEIKRTYPASRTHGLFIT